MAKRKKQSKSRKTTTKKTTKSLLGAWVCDLANRLMDESGLPVTRREAFRQAHLMRRLLEALGEGVVQFSYRKADGTLRRARGTLAAGFDPLFDAYEYKAPLQPTVYDDALCFAYWDLDKHAFRAFTPWGVNILFVIEEEEGRNAL